MEGEPLLDQAAMTVVDVPEIRLVSHLSPESISSTVFQVPNCRFEPELADIIKDSLSSIAENDGSGGCGFGGLCREADGFTVDPRALDTHHFAGAHASEAGENKGGTNALHFGQRSLTFLPPRDNLEPLNVLIARCPLPRESVGNLFRSGAGIFLNDAAAD